MSRYVKGLQPSKIALFDFCNRTCAAGTSARWITGDSVYGDDRRLRVWLESQPQAYVLAVSGQEYVWLGWQQRRVNIILAALPEDGWSRWSAGDGAKGPRWYDGRWRPLAEPLEPTWRRWRLIRRSSSDPTEVRASVVCAPQETTLEVVVRVAGASTVEWFKKSLPPPLETSPLAACKASRGLSSR